MEVRYSSTVGNEGDIELFSNNTVSMIGRKTCLENARTNLKLLPSKINSFCLYYHDWNNITDDWVASMFRFVLTYIIPVI